MLFLLTFAFAFFLISLPDGVFLSDLVNQDIVVAAALLFFIQVLAWV